MPITSVGDITMDMGIYKSTEIHMGSDEKEIYKALMEGKEMSLDQLCKVTGKNRKIIAQIVAVMEIKGIICTSSGKIFIAK